VKIIFHRPNRPFTQLIGIILDLFFQPFRLRGIVSPRSANAEIRRISACPVLSCKELALLQPEQMLWPSCELVSAQSCPARSRELFSRGPASEIRHNNLFSKRNQNQPLETGLHTQTRFPKPTRATAHLNGCD
jgi:hypothetical protein